MEEYHEVTSTSFRVVVFEARPYSFDECISQQVRSSVRITHIAFTPPTADDVESYASHQQKRHQNQARTLKESFNANSAPRQATLARLTTFCASGKLETHTLACFPWGACTLSHAAATGTDDGDIKRGAGHDPLPARVQLGGVYDVALPQLSDVCGNVDIRFDVDGSVRLEVVGPGSVTFFGEQYSALIPEWLDHHFFTLDDEESEEISDDDSTVPMSRLNF
uniref:Uncharacterized protein n=1 Tax=Trypanosoma congolense (strain IL3000) TaxID=1068625 RepID=G0UXP4_TRYCI|nr:conserved hypothetical protein [Trypanosoma congolense IL3000]